MRIIEIEIKNWEKHNPRSDVKTARWFKMSNDFFNDPEFYDVSIEGKMAWLFLLCSASRKMVGTVKINTQMVADNLKIREESVSYALNELIRTGSILVKSVTLVSEDLLPERKDKVTNEIRALEERREEEKREEKRREEVFTPSVETAAVGVKKTPAKKPNKQPLTQTTWESYQTAYRQRYGVDPIRNATVNSKIKQFVERVGVEESPEVARFYVFHNAQKYVASAHSAGNLLFDAEKLRTEWARGRQITAADARSTETKQHIVNVFERHLNASGGHNVG